MGCGHEAPASESLYNRLQFFAATPQFRVPNYVERPAEILEAIETFFDDVDAGRVTQAHRAIVAEGRAGTTATFALLNKRSAKFCELSPSWLMFTRM